MPGSRNAEKIIATLREPFVVLDGSLRIKSANASFYRAFHLSKGNAEGQLFFEFGGGQWDIPGLRLMLDAVDRQATVHDFEVYQDFPSIGPRSLLVNARRFPPEAKDPALIRLGIEDVTDRRRAEQANKGSELRYRRLFQTAKDGILILDAQTGFITDANPFICGLLGYELENFLGKELWQIGLLQDKRENQIAYRELREKGYIRYDHLPLKTTAGREVDVEFVSNVYRVDHQQTILCNIRDISDRVQLEKAAKEQAKSLADLHRRKEEFLAMLSHELRNPALAHPQRHAPAPARGGREPDPAGGSESHRTAGRTADPDRR